MSPSSGVPNIDNTPDVRSSILLHKLIILAAQKELQIRFFNAVEEIDWGLA